MISIVPERWSQRKSDISFYDTIRELTDNSVDAEATNVTIILSKDTCMICDNGDKSMDVDALNSCLIKGRSDKDNMKIGSFGEGLKQSIVQFNTDGSGSATCHILSGTINNDKPFYGYISACPHTINEAIRENGIEGWCIEPAINLVDRQVLKNAYQNICMDAYSEFICDDDFHTGTVILITDCDVPELKDNASLISTRENLMIHLGERYYERLINSNLKITIRSTNSYGGYDCTEVRPKDWLMREKEGTEIFEFVHEEPDRTPLVFRIAVTHQHSYLTRNLKQELYKPVNSENAGISLCFNGVIVALATKSQVATPSILEAYKKLCGGKERGKVFFNEGDNYSATIRVMVYADKTWQDTIRMDETKISFMFDDRIAPVLAQLMVELNKAKTVSEAKKKAQKSAPVIPSVPIPQPSAQVYPTQVSTRKSANKITYSDLLDMGFMIALDFPAENHNLLVEFSDKFAKQISERLGLE